MISGGGSGLEALLRFQSKIQRCHQTVLVLADRVGASGLSHGKKRSIRSIGIPIPDNASKSENRLAHEKMIQAELESSKIELVVLTLVLF